MVAATHFEAKKHAYRQTQDGIVISFVCHPNDVSALLAMAPLGTRFMVAIAELSDDEPTSDNGSEETAALNLKGGDANGAGTGSSGPSGADTTLPHAEQSATHGAKRHRKFSDMPRSQQCAIRCTDKGFQKWLRAADDDAAATWVRSTCGITSRAELDSDPGAAETWHQIESEFKDWLTTAEHAETFR